MTKILQLEFGDWEAPCSTEQKPLDKRGRQEYLLRPREGRGLTLIRLLNSARAASSDTRTVEPMTSRTS